MLNIIQAAELGCDDSVQPGDNCHPCRVAGTVLAGSVRGNMSADDFEFAITDGCFGWPIYYRGDPASVAHLNARDFVVAQGETSVDGNFHSARIFVGSEAATLGGDLRQYQSGIPREACLESRARVDRAMGWPSR